MNMQEYVELKHKYSFEFNKIDTWDKLDHALAWAEFEAALEEFAENDKASSPCYDNDGRDLMDTSPAIIEDILEDFIERYTPIGTEVMRNAILSNTGIYC